ncbi:unnamed protein product [Rotaria socialis]|uniref:ceramide glucosyltransferase n=1 Tax=Rotaria socialis TaxID=392032 RepID=A0A817PT47_9BILA|nr:unnamed protein product [Rotaria socialis]
MSFLHIIYTLALTVSLVLAILVLILVWLFHCGGLSYGFYKFHRKKIPNNLKELPGISIIKPLTCADSNLYDNLKTFFNLKYPRYELLFCLQEHDSELIAMIERLRAQYPHVESQLFVGSQYAEKRQENNSDDDDDDDDDNDNQKNDNLRSVSNNKDIPSTSKRMISRKRPTCCGTQKFSSGDALLKTGTMEIVNPKIFNMLGAYEKAQYPLFLISDSGLMMYEDTLFEMALCMTEDVGLVHQMPFTANRQGFAGTVEKVYFGTQHARMYMAINLLGVNCVTGMSCLIRKACIDQVGGLKAFGRYIAEDYYLAYEVSKQGFKLRVAPTPAQQNSGNYSIKSWTDRMIRWCKLRMRLSPLAYIEPLQESFSSAILAGLVTNYLLEWNALVVGACHILLWFICDYIILRITQGGPLPFSKFEFAVAWLIRELSSFYIYFKAFTGPATITWRGKIYRLGSGTRVDGLHSSSSSQSSAPTLTVESSSIPTSSNSILPVTG